MNFKAQLAAKSKSIYRRIMPDALIIRQATVASLRMKTDYMTFCQCSSRALKTVTCLECSNTLRITDKLCNMRTEHLFCTQRPHSCLQRIINPMVRIMLTKTKSKICPSQRHT